MSFFTTMVGLITIITAILAITKFARDNRVELEEKFEESKQKFKSSLPQIPFLDDSAPKTEKTTTGKTEVDNPPSTLTRRENQNNENLQIIGGFRIQQQETIAPVTIPQTTRTTKARPKPQQAPTPNSIEIVNETSTARKLREQGLDKDLTRSTSLAGSRDTRIGEVRQDKRGNTTFNELKKQEANRSALIFQQLFGNVSNPNFKTGGKN